MKATQVLARLNKAVETKRAKLLDQAKKTKRQKPSEYFDPKHRAEQLTIEANKLSPRNITDLVYKVRSNYFENYSGSCGFNPETLHAHSYRWYTLASEIKGVMVLNTYSYSNQTAKHIGKMHDVLKVLGIKYQCLNAPRGLQDLDAALSYELSFQAGLLVREKYARIKSQWTKSSIKQSESRVLLLAKFGKKATKKMREQALVSAENNRKSRNERARKQAALRKAMASLEIVSDYSNSMHGAQGLHLIKTADWAWRDGLFTGRLSDWDKRDAVNKGFTKIIIHSQEPRHLSLVQEA